MGLNSQNSSFGLTGGSTGGGGGSITGGDNGITLISAGILGLGGNLIQNTLIDGSAPADANTILGLLNIDFRVSNHSLISFNVSDVAELNSSSLLMQGTSAELNVVNAAVQNFVFRIEKISDLEGFATEVLSDNLLILKDGGGSGNLTLLKIAGYGAASAGYVLTIADPTTGRVSWTNKQTVFLMDADFNIYSASTGSTGQGDGDNFIVGRNAGAGDISGVTISCFIGSGAGSGATNSNASQFIGNNAGSDAANAGSSVFIGTMAGTSAINMQFSVAIGASAGLGTNDAGKNAQNSVFLGNHAGDQTAFGAVVHGANDWNICIGYLVTTNTFNNSIIMGGSSDGSPVANTKENQFMLTDNIINVRLRGIEYELPATLSTGDKVLHCNGATGVMSWQSA